MLWCFPLSIPPQTSVCMDEQMGGGGGGEYSGGSRAIEKNACVTSLTLLLPLYILPWRTQVHNRHMPLPHLQCCTVTCTHTCMVYMHGDTYTGLGLSWLAGGAPVTCVGQRRAEVHVQMSEVILNSCTRKTWKCKDEKVMKTRKKLGAPTWSSRDVRSIEEAVNHMS